VTEILHALDGKALLLLLALLGLGVYVLRHLVAQPGVDELLDQHAAAEQAEDRAAWARANRDRGSSAPLSLGALLVGLAAIGLLFAAVSATVGPAMNAPARHGGSECGGGLQPGPDGTCP
jgi:hypothetical protein